MRSAELNGMLLKSFPQLEKSYSEEVSWQEGDDTGSHVVFGDVFTPYVRDCINENKTEELNRIFSFIESVLGTGDSYADEVVSFSVIESLSSTINERPDIKALMGSVSAGILNELTKQA